MVVTPILSEYFKEKCTNFLSPLIFYGQPNSINILNYGAPNKEIIPVRVTKVNSRWATYNGLIRLKFVSSKQNMLCPSLGFDFLNAFNFISDEPAPQKKFESELSSVGTYENRRKRSNSAAVNINVQINLQ